MPVTSTLRGAMARSRYTIEACTRLLTRSSRAECHGSGTRLLLRYANDTPESGSAQQYDEPTPPWPNVRGDASEPRPRIVSVVPQVRTEPAVHRHPHVGVDAVAGVVTGDVGDGPR